MRDFVLLFDEKEGTSPLIRLLDAFPDISIVHQEGGGWEPFDLHRSGPISIKSLTACLSALFGSDTPDVEAINRIYMRTARQPLAAVAPDTAVGFKMRFVPSGDLQSASRWLRLLAGWFPDRALQLHRRRFRDEMFKIFRRHDVVVFIAVRQDVLRWALSKLHGDGTGRPGHLQFRLSRGRIRREDIPALAVDCDALDRVIGECESMHRDKAQLLDELRAAGLSAHPVLYERFCDDPLAFFAEMLEHIEKHADPAEISAVLERGTEFQKVHSPDIADFVVNHEEVLERFSTRFVAWD